jgi:peroxiredoxin
MKQLTILTSYMLVASSAGLLEAAVIELKDKTKVAGDVVQVEDEYVFIRLPRQSIATVDGVAPPVPLVEGVAAPVFSVKDLQGQPRSLGQGKVTVLHFWIHWCPHCGSDAPQVQALYDRFHDNPNVQVLTVTLDDTRDVVDQFVKDRRVTYPIILAAEQSRQPDGVNLAELYQITGFPVTYLIDAEGVIRHKIRGSFVESNVDVVSLIEQLLPKPRHPQAEIPTS